MTIIHNTDFAKLLSWELLISCDPGYQPWLRTHAQIGSSMGAPLQAVCVWISSQRNLYTNLYHSQLKRKQCSTQVQLLHFFPFFYVMQTKGLRGRRQGSLAHSLKFSLRAHKVLRPSAQMGLEYVGLFQHTCRMYKRYRKPKSDAGGKMRTINFLY